MSEYEIAVLKRKLEEIAALEAGLYWAKCQAFNMLSVLLAHSEPVLRMAYLMPEVVRVAILPEQDYESEWLYVRIRLIVKPCAARDTAIRYLYLRGVESRASLYLHCRYADGVLCKYVDIEAVEEGKDERTEDL